MSNVTKGTAQAKSFDIVASDSDSRTVIFGTIHGPMIVNLNDGDRTKKDIEDWLEKNDLLRHVKADFSISEDGTEIRNIRVVENESKD